MTDNVISETVSRNAALVQSNVLSGTRTIQHRKYRLQCDSTFDSGRVSMVTIVKDTRAAQNLRVPLGPTRCNGIYQNKYSADVRLTVFAVEYGSYWKEIITGSKIGLKLEKFLN